MSGGANMTYFFFQDRRGNVAIIFALVSVVLLAAIGGAVDFGRALSLRAKLQAAVDATALAANYQAEGLSSKIIQKTSLERFNAIYKAPAGYAAAPTVDVSKGVVTVTASVSMPLYFGAFIGQETLDVDVISEAVVGKTSFDVVLVLDNSGSMGGSKIRTLKTASNDLVDTLFGINDISDKKDRVKIGVVPFTSFVNIGADKESSLWMDREGLSPAHWKNFETDGRGEVDVAAFDPGALYNSRPSRFSLYEQVGTKWRGCVDARPMPYDVNDDAPESQSSRATADRLFVPSFAPDEPDYNNDRGKRYYNDWLDDEGGDCPRTQLTGSDEHIVGQRRLCKYRNQKKNYGSRWTIGPNYWCKTQELTDLTTAKNTVKNAIDSMRADGHTNIHQGVIWGWRVLSPQAPFTEGRVAKEDEDEELKRIMIVMTDGANTYVGRNTHNDTDYHAYGYGSEERLGAGVDKSYEIERKMDERTALSCANAKKDGEVDIYTVAFQIYDTSTIKMMEECATRPTMAFDARSNADLSAAFKRIASEISRLRLNK